MMCVVCGLQPDKCWPKSVRAGATQARAACWHKPFCWSCTACLGKVEHYSSSPNLFFKYFIKNNKIKENLKNFH